MNMMQLDVFACGLHHDAQVATLCLQAYPSHHVKPIVALYLRWLADGGFATPCQQPSQWLGGFA